MQAKLKIILSMAIFGTISIFVKNISLSSGEIALFRAITAAVVISVYKIISGKRISFSYIKKDLPALFVSGIAMGFNWIFLFQAYKYTTVSIATLSYYFAPVIVMAACPILFKEKLTIKQVVCFVMATLGLIMVIGVSGMGKYSNNLIGIGFGLSAAVLYATVVLFNKFIKNVTGIDKTLIQFFAAIIILTPYVFATTGIHIGSLENTGIINLLILGIIHTGICYCLYFSSLKDLKGQEASILSYVDPLIAIIASVTILGESILPMQIIGGIMILGFTLLNEIKLKPRRFYGIANKKKNTQL
ncbi:DMT family transporter [Clostridium beijerinckii]|uniref:RarD protein n=1 Tax=Clostridium beijerinckii TaxID=1520 RepID=A0AAX0AUU2_CLOBE|nr:DMT family transporter [Clostridium beijerinckii]NOW04779.1 RarD protein [Clostridium beijerinckii]NRT35796.1 RarD protein [Clostridium beijerinckii]NRT44778.1 RarD protein [Clostridium beijerinckii]NRT86765.1 RarD protein [Clostridium beijerinckii]NRZ21230.1 RarD protein [Clostridium beijerinckii]